MKIRRLSRTNNIPGYPLIRLILGYVFLLAGAQKLLYPAAAGERFLGLGFPLPAFTAGLVGVLEALCGLLILAGLFTRLAAVPVAVIMAVAIATTKLPRLAGGFWEFAPAVRLDAAMLLLALFVIINGADRFSLDRRL